MPQILDFAKRGYVAVTVSYRLIPVGRFPAQVEDVKCAIRYLRANADKHHLDPNNHNGAVFLGLNGVVVKSHGSATAKGVAHAVAVTARLLENKLTERIAQDLSRLGEGTLRQNGRTGTPKGSEATA